MTLKRCGHGKRWRGEITTATFLWHHDAEDSVLDRDGIFLFVHIESCNGAEVSICLRGHEGTAICGLLESSQMRLDNKEG